MMEIKITDNQETLIKGLVNVADERRLLNDIINTGLLYYYAPPKTRVLVMELLDPRNNNGN